jgi:hypothetical protein
VIELVAYVRAIGAEPIAFVTAMAEEIDFLATSPELGISRTITTLVAIKISGTDRRLG